MSVEIDIDFSSYEITIAHTQQAIPKLTPRLVFETGQIVKETMQNVVPVKTGKLKRSIRHDSIGDSSVVSTNSGYGLFVDQPTRPHVIEAKNASFLRIPLPNGTVIFRKKVFHTGTKGAFFRRSTLLRSKDRIREMVDDKLKEAIRL